MGGSARLAPLIWKLPSGVCTHGAGLLADGLVDGNLVECPKHNGCFDFKTGAPKRLPVKTRLATYPVRLDGSTVYVQVGAGEAPAGEPGGKGGQAGGARTLDEGPKILS